MNIEIESIGEIKVVRVKEEKLVFPLLSSFFAKVSELIDAGAGKLVIDLSDVSYIDSASIGCLMDIYRMMTERSGAVRLLGLQERVETMVSLTGLHNLVEIFREETTALESF